MGGVARAWVISDTNGSQWADEKDLSGNALTNSLGPVIMSAKITSTSAFSATLLTSTSAFNQTLLTISLGI